MLQRIFKRRQRDLNKQVGPKKCHGNLNCPKPKTCFMLLLSLPFQTRFCSPSNSRLILIFWLKRHLETLEVDELIPQPRMLFHYNPMCGSPKICIQVFQPKAYLQTSSRTRVLEGRPTAKFKADYSSLQHTFVL